VPFTFNLTPPDLVPITFQAPAVVTGGPNPRVTLVWSVTNQGAGAAEPGQWGSYWHDRLYLSGSAALDGTERWVGQWDATATLLPGSTYRQTNTVRVPVTDSGTYYLILEANADHVLDEWNVFNNSLAVPVTFNLGDPPPPGTLEGGLLPDGSFFVDVYGELRAQYTLEASTDLVHWERIADFICGNPTTVLDPDAARFGRRFYRVTLLTQPAELRLDLVPGVGGETGGGELRLDGPLDRFYRVELSTDLLEWEPLKFFHLVQSPTRLQDPSAPNASVRFYRAVMP